MADMLTDDQVQRVARLVRLAPYMDQEMREKLLMLVRDLKAGDAAGIMPSSAIQQMTDCIDDKTMRVIVEEQRHRPEPGFLPPDSSPPKEKGSGWQKPTELSSPPGIKYVDQLIDVQDAVDKRELEKRLGGR
jgi:hypothetical protein